MSNEDLLQSPPNARSARRASHSGIVAGPLAIWPRVNSTTDNGRQSAVSDVVAFSPSLWDWSNYESISTGFNPQYEPRQGLSSHSTQQMDRKTPSHSVSGEPQSQHATDADTQVPKQITYLISLTDQVLTKRTQLEHEEGTLEQQQQYLNESSFSLLNAFIENLPRITARNNIVDERPQRGQEVSRNDAEAISFPLPPPPPSPSAQIDRHDSEGGVALGSAHLEASGDSSTAVSSNGPIDVLWTRYKDYQRDYDALHLRRDKVAALRNELTVVEYRLRKRQTEFLDALKSMQSEMPQFGSQVLERASEAMGSFVPSEPSKSDAPSLLATYFDRKGDVGIFRDRLLELDYYFQEGLVERELILDRGDELENTDSQFRADYVKNRKNIESDLRNAEQDVASLAAACQAANIPITNTVRRASSSIEGSSLRHSGGQTDPDAPVDPLPESKAGRRRKHRIEGWLEDVPVGSESHNDEEFSSDAEIIERESTEEEAHGQTEKETTLDSAEHNAPQIAPFTGI